MFRIKEGFVPFVKTYPVTTAIVFICLLQGVTTLLLGGYTSENRMLLGAYSATSVNEGEFWRLFTYAFGHMSVFHLFLNLPFLLIIARPLEKLFGHSLFLLTYVILSLGAGMSIHFLSSYPVPLAGSSGPAFGMLGIYLYLTLMQKELFFPADKRFFHIFIGIALLSTFLVPDISVTGHIGGLISGILFALLLFIIKPTRWQDTLRFY